MPESRRSALRRALRHPGFRRLFIAQTISRWGDTFNTVAFVIVVFRLTGSGVQVGGAVIMEIAPVLLLGLMAGVVVDHLPRRQVMITADIGRAAIAAVLVLSPDHLWTLYPAAFGLSALTVFFNPAAASIVPALVDDDELIAANSAAVLSQIALAPLAGGLITWAGPRAAFAINAASFLVSAAILARLPVPAKPATHDESRRTQVTGGLRIIRQSRFHTTLATVQALAALSAGATSALLVVLAQRHLDVGAGGFGLLLAPIGIGAALGPLVLQRLVSDVRHPALLFGPYLLRGAVDLALATFANLAIALTALAAYGIGTSTATSPTRPPSKPPPPTSSAAASSPSTTSSGKPPASPASPSAASSPTNLASAASTSWAAYCSSPPAPSAMPEPDAKTSSQPSLASPPELVPLGQRRRPARRRTDHRGVRSGCRTTAQPKSTCLGFDAVVDAEAGCWRP